MANLLIGAQRKFASRRMALYRSHNQDQAMADPEQAENFGKIVGQSFKEHWSSSSSTGGMIPHWRIVYIATLPEHQGHGYATRLLKWGIEQAEQDHMPLGVDTSRAWLRLYTANGFKEIGRVYFDEVVGYICKRDTGVT